MRANVDTVGQCPVLRLLDGVHQVGKGVDIYYPLVGASQFAIIGNEKNPENVVVNCDAASNCFFVQEPATVTLSDFKVTTSGPGSVAVNVRQFATCDVQRLVFGEFPSGIHVSATEVACVNFLAPSYTIAGGATFHVLSTNGSKVFLNSVDLKVPKPVAFNSFAYVDNATLMGDGPKLSGAGVAGSTGAKITALNSAHAIGVANYMGNTVGSRDFTSIVDAIPRPGFYAEMASSNESIPPRSLTRLKFPKVRKNDGAYDSKTGRWAPTNPRMPKVELKVTWGRGGAAGTYIRIAILKNGNLEEFANDYDYLPAPNAIKTQTVSRIDFDYKPGDYYEAYAYSNVPMLVSGDASATCFSAEEAQ